MPSWLAMMRHQATSRGARERIPSSPLRSVSPTTALPPASEANSSTQFPAQLVVPSHGAPNTLSITVAAMYEVSWVVRNQDASVTRLPRMYTPPLWTPGATRTVSPLAAASTAARTVGWSRGTRSTLANDGAAAKSASSANPGYDRNGGTARRRGWCPGGTASGMVGDCGTRPPRDGCGAGWRHHSTRRPWVRKGRTDTGSRDGDTIYGCH